MFWFIIESDSGEPNRNGDYVYENLDGGVQKTCVSLAGIHQAM